MVLPDAMDYHVSDICVDSAVSSIYTPFGLTLRSGQCFDKDGILAR